MTPEVQQRGAVCRFGVFMAEKYDFGPPVLTDEEAARLEDLFRYSEPEVQDALRVLGNPNSGTLDRIQAQEVLRKWRDA